ncbi:MAG: hypothetical protein WD894_17255 [Pirellulales bacterium]
MNHSEQQPKDNAASCPTCGRRFQGIHDYPRVHILAFERLPIPEAVDQMSAAAAGRRLSRLRSDPDNTGLRREDGINMTPAIAEACDRPEVQAYFDQLSKAVGQEVEPTQLLPALKAHGVFRWAYPVEGTRLYLALKESEPPTKEERIATVQIYCDGPNMGSAGGPTMQALGPIAQIRYRGLLMNESRPVGP